VTSRFDRWAHGHETIPSLLNDALGFVQTNVPHALALRLYHLSAHGVMLGASTQPPTESQAFIVFDDGSPYTEVLAHRAPVFNAERESWLASLDTDSTTYGLMEISLSSNADAPYTPDDDQRDWIALIAVCLGQALDTRKLQELARRQAVTSSQLTQATDFQQIAKILAANLISDGQFIGMNLFITDAQGAFAGFRTLATASHSRVFSGGAKLDNITLADLGTPLSRMTDENRPFLVSDIASNDTISPVVKAWMAEYGVAALCVFPMRSQGVTFGLIALNSTSSPLYLAEPEMAIYQSLADQVSTLVQLGRVAERADLTSAISERQKQAFNELVAGQDFTEMAGIIARHMLPDTGRYLVIMELLYDAHGGMMGWHVLASANRSRSFNWRDTPLEIPILELKTSIIQAWRDGELFAIPDVDSPQAEAQLGSPMTHWLRNEALQSVLTLPLMSNDRPIAVLMVLAREAHAFTREEVNAFTTIAGQMGVLVQVRQLLDQALTARTLVDNLVLANRLVTVATDYPYMAQGITYTVARHMRGAALTLFDQPLAEGAAPKFRRMVGLSTQDELLPIDPQQPLADLQDLALHQRLRTGQAVIAYSVDADNGWLSPEARAIYAGLGVTWVAAFGLRTGDLLLGTLDLLHDQAYDLTSAEIDAYTTLADQIGMTIRSRQLVTQSQEAQATASQLIQTNLRIATAANYTEMVQAIVQTLPENITMVGLLLFDAPLTIGDKPHWLKTEVVASRTSAVEPNIVDYFPDTTAPEDMPMLVALLSGEFVTVEDTRLITRPNFVMKNLLVYMGEQGLYSFAAIVLRAGARYLGVLGFGAPDFGTLSSLQRENLRAIAGEVAVAIENRLLVNQTAEALRFLALQYEISSALYRAQEPQKMLAALYQFVRSDYTQARLGVIDPDAIKARIIVEMNATGETTTAPRRSGALYATPITRSALEGEDIIISDDHHILTLPLTTTDGVLIGLVQFVNVVEAVDLPLNTLRALRSLADQMTTNLQNRVLLQQTEDSLQQTRVLYEVNRALLETTDNAEILQTLQVVIASGASALTFTSLDYATIDGALTSLMLEVALTPDEMHQPQVDIAEIMDAERLSALKTWCEANGSDIEFAHVVGEFGVTQALMTTYQQQLNLDFPVSSSVAIPILENGMVIHLVHVLFQTPQIFERTTRQLYKAVRDQLTIVLQNQRLIRNTRASAAQLGSQVRVLQVLNQLALNTNNLQDEPALMDEAAQAFYNALRLDHCGIILLNQDGKSGTVVSDYPGQSMVGLQVTDNDDLQLQLRTTRQSIYIPDVASEPRLSPNSRDALMQFGIQTILLVPLINADNQFLGSVSLEYYALGHQISDELRDISRTIAAQVALGLQNIRQAHNTQRQSTQLQALVNFSQQLQTKSALPAILEATAHIQQILLLDHLRLLLLDAELGTLYIALEIDRGSISLDTLPTPSGFEATAAGQAWATRQVVTGVDLRLPSATVQPSQPDLRAVMAAPLLAYGAPAGVLELASATPYAYTDTDLLVFSQVVNQLGVALENAQTYAQNQRVAHSKALVNEISSQIQKQVDLDSLLSVTVNELGRALGARQARVRLGNEADLKNARKTDASESW
ncbi:MAG: GAF domain-containing protein, partial [Armatimonadetes bacterium]|nr:GAF domain-containing protein [Anaerolineae bacterium]